MTKTERKALENYTNHLWDMKQYYKEQVNRMETESNREWYQERVKEYFNAWVAAHSMLRMLEDKEDLKYWANTEV